MCIPSYENGTRRARAHVFLDDEDLTYGDLEHLVPDAVGTVLERVKPTPRALIITLTCVDDILGTDHDALLRELAARYPQVRFAIHHMDPIRLESGPAPRVSYALAQYSLLGAPRRRDRAVNVVGSVGTLVPASDLFDLAHAAGIEVRQLADSLSVFLEQENSAWNLAIHPVGLQAVQMLEKRYGTPYAYLPRTIDPQKVLLAYARLAELWGVSLPGNALGTDARFDAESRAVRAQAAIRAARTRVGDTPIVVGRSADWRPASLARDLLELGFNVVCVTQGVLFDGDASDVAWLQANHPEVELARGGDSLLMRRADLRTSVCVGYPTAYALGAHHVVDWPEAEEHWGFEAVEHFAGLLVAAMDQDETYGESAQGDGGSAQGNGGRGGGR